MRVKVIGKVIPASFLKIEGWGTFVEVNFPGAEKGKRGGSKKEVRGGETARGAMAKSRYIGVIEEEEVRRDDPIKYFLPMGIGSTS